jgi:tetratricopeptide (TPR) repeat protein
MFREAEFAFKQAYAFCPYSPEALYRYVNLLATARRFDDALLLAKTSHKLDPGNAQLERLVDELDKLRLQNSGGAAAPAPSPELQKAEAKYKANKTDFNSAVTYAQAAAAAGDVGRVVQVADDIVANPQADAVAIQFAMQIYAQPQVHDYAKLEKALQRWTTLSPTAEAWLDLAGAQAVQNKSKEAIASLQRSLEINAARLKSDPKASNLVPVLNTDPRFASLRAAPEFQAMLKTNQ